MYNGELMHGSIFMSYQEYHRPWSAFHKASLRHRGSNLWHLQQRRWWHEQCHNEAAGRTAELWPQLRCLFPHPSSVKQRKSNGKDSNELNLWERESWEEVWKFNGPSWVFMGGLEGMDFYMMYIIVLFNLFLWIANYQFA